MTTIHSYTNDQRILTLPSGPPQGEGRRAVDDPDDDGGGPKAVGIWCFRTPRGSSTDSRLRVPTPDVSVVDLLPRLKKRRTSKRSTPH